MFLNHDAAFETFAPVTPVSALGHRLTLTASTLIEAERGWLCAAELTSGDSVATLDGGFAELRAVETAPDAPLIHIPGGTLSTCSDAVLPADTHVALDMPAAFSDAPVVSVPLQALVGWRGIRRAENECAPCVTLMLRDEELVYAHTGLLLHAGTAAPGFYERKSYGETRALLALMDGTMPAPDLATAA